MHVKISTTLLYLLLLVTINLKAVDYTSIASGDWGTPTNWSPNGIPSASDDVTISVGHTIDISTQRLCKNLTVNGIINWTGNYRMVVYGDYLIAATGSETGASGLLSHQGTGTRYTTCLGTASPNITYDFYQNYTISAGSNFNKANITLTIYNNNTTITNLGTITIGSIKANSSYTGITWINGANSYLILTYFLQGPLNFQANATGNTVEDKSNYVSMLISTTGFYNLIFNSATSRNLYAATTVANNLTISTGTNLNANGYDLNIGGNWLNNGTFIPGTKTVTFNGTNQTITKTGGETFYNLLLAGTGTTTLATAVTTTANLTINSGATLNVSTSNYAVNIKGNFTNNGTFTPQAGTVTFNGTAAQSIIGSSSTTFSGLTVIKNTNSLTLSSPIHISNMLTLTKGNIITDATNLLTINNGATVSGGSTSSFISGPLSKVGNTSFTFPIGKGTNYQPLAISAPTTITDAYTAEYFGTVQTDGATIDATINNLSTCEYWDFSKTNGSSSVSITLGWNASSCNRINPDLMKIARWNGALWKDEGGINSTGTITTGTTTTATAQNTFGHYTLAKSSAGYVSITSGDWGTPTNWLPNGIPGASDNVNIRAGDTIILSVNVVCNNLTINGVLNTNNKVATIFGNYTISDTGIESGTTASSIYFIGTTGNTIVCTGTSSPNIHYAFRGSYTITANSIIDKSIGQFLLQVSNITVRNFGTLTAGKLSMHALAKESKFVNDTNATLILIADIYIPAADFIVNTIGNTVILNFGGRAIPATTTGYYNLNITGTGTKSAYGSLMVANNLTINTGNELSSYYCPTITVGGNWINNGRFIPHINTLIFNGAGVQHVSRSIAAETFSNVIVDKPSGKLQLNSVVNIISSITLTKGIVKTSAINLLKLADNALVNGGSDISYVSGPMLKTGNDLFTFPLGDSTVSIGSYHPLVITAPTLTSDAYQAEYFAKNILSVYPSNTSIESASLEHIGKCDYWQLTRVAGNSVVKASLSWNSGSCNESADAIRVCSWDGIKWKNLGNSGVTVNGNIGIVPATSSITNATQLLSLGTLKAPLAITPSSANICAGGSAVLLASGSSTYTWNPSTGLDISTGNRVIASPQTNTTYTVTGIDVDGTSSSLPITITILPTPVAAFSSTDIHLVPPLTLACINNALNFTNTSSNATVYQWQVNGLSVGSTANLAYSFNTAGAYTVSLVASNGSCSDTKDLVLTIKPNTIVASAGDDVSLTTGSSVTIGGSPVATGGSLPYSYAWLPSDNLNSATLANPIATPLQTTTYTLKVTDGAGCSHQDDVTVSVLAASKSYAVLTKKLDGGYYDLKGSTLYFKYTGEYNTGNLTVKVYDEQHRPKICPQITTKQYGDNRFELDLNTCTDIIANSGYYIMEVENEKAEKYLLKFKY